MKRISASCALPLSLGLFLSVGCSGDDPPPGEKPDPTLNAIAVSAQSLSVSVEDKVRFRATGTYSDDSTAVLRTATWSSSDVTVATVDDSGLVTAIGAGTTMIMAQVDSVVGSATLTVRGTPLESILIQPQAVELLIGEGTALEAVGTLADGSFVDLSASATWRSSDESVATVVGGQVTAVSAGTIIITAEDPASGITSGDEGSATVTIRTPQPTSLSVMPTSATLALGRTVQFTAILEYEDGTMNDVSSEVVWSSADPLIAQVDASGLATAVADGFVLITANHAATDLRGTARITVTPPAIERVVVTPGTATIDLQTRQQFVANAIYSDGTMRSLTNSVMWMSSDPAIASIDDMTRRGAARAVSMGTVTISAVDPRSGMSSEDTQDSATLTVRAPVLESIIVIPATTNIAAGLTAAFQAFGIMSDESGVEMTTMVTWSTSNANAATVDATGLVQAIAEGTAVISVTDPITGISSDDANQSSQVTIDPPILLSIEVTPPSAAMVIGITQQFTATAQFSDAISRDISSTVTWNSSSPSITITPTGFASAVAIGTVTISALDAASGISSDDSNQSATVLVSDANLVSIAVTPPTTTVPVGADLALTAMGTYDNTAVVDITGIVSWTSGTPAAARVSNSAGARGVVSAIAAGTTIVSAVEPVSGITSAAQSATVAVDGTITLQSMTVAPSSASFNVNRSFAFTVDGTFSDTSVHPMTESVTWASSNGSIAAVSNTEGSRGVVTGVGVGSSVISAMHTPSGISTSGAQNAVATIQQGIEVADVVHYELDDATGTTVANLAPGQPNGTITGAFTWNTMGGAPGTSSHYLSMANASINNIQPNLASTTFTNMTIDFWWRFGAGTGLSYMWNSSVSFRAFTNGVAGVGIYVRATPGGADVIHAPSVQDQNWHHVAYVLDATGGQGRLYFDGMLVGSTTYSGAITITNWVLAGQASTNGASVDYDRLRVWGSAQTAAQIADMVIGNR